MNFVIKNRIVKDESNSEETSSIDTFIKNYAKDEAERDALIAEFGASIENILPTNLNNSGYIFDGWCGIGRFWNI